MSRWIACAPIGCGISLCLLAGCAGLPNQKERSPLVARSVTAAKANERRDATAQANMPGSIRSRRVADTPATDGTPEAPKSITAKTGSATSPATAGSDANVYTLNAKLGRSRSKVLPSSTTATSDLALASVPPKPSPVPPAIMRAPQPSTENDNGAPERSARSSLRQARIESVVPPPPATSSTATARIATTDSHPNGPNAVETLPPTPANIELPRRSVANEKDAGGSTAVAKTAPTVMIPPLSEPVAVAASADVPSLRPLTKSALKTKPTGEAEDSDRSRPSLFVQTGKSLPAPESAAEPSAGSKTDIVSAPPALMTPPEKSAANRESPPRANVAAPLAGAATTTTVIAAKPAEPASVGTVAANMPTPSALGRLPLDIGRLEFCTQVKGFGEITAMPKEYLNPGRQVLLYAEIGNFESKHAGDEYETRLASQLTLESGDGKILATLDFDPIVDRCRTNRKDFYCHYTFSLPVSLAPNHYVLRLKVKDLASGERTERTMDFVVTGTKSEE